MRDPQTIYLALAGLYFVPALVWGILAHHEWVFVRTRRPAGEIYRLFPILFSLAAFFYLVLMVGIQPEIRGGSLHAVLVGLGLLCVIAVGAVVRHMITAVPSSFSSAQRAGSSWLTVNYGSAVLVGVVVVLPLLRGASPPSPAVSLSGTMAGGYLLLMATLAGVRMRGRMRRGPMRVGTLWGQIHYTDYVTWAVIAGLILALVIAGHIAGPEWGPGRHVVLVAIGLVGAVPFVVRTAFPVLRRVLLAMVVIVAAGGVTVGAHALSLGLESATLGAFVGFGAVLGLVALLVPGRRWLERVVDRVVLRHEPHPGEALRAFLQTLAPEFGTLECCQRALAEVARVMEVPRAAILVTRDGGAVTHGGFVLEPLRRVWPIRAAADPLPGRAFTWSWLDDPILKEALVEADVVAVVPIASPRRPWGHLFISTGLLGGTTREAHLEALETFAAQLALVLDGSELLARAVAVERSLAHAEKLAAIGETAARIVHEIRNPVTAARSLAQQLARDPTSPLNAEHAALVVAELERVEQQVTALLRFARRETFAFARVDLGGLVRATAESYRPRLAAAGVDVELDLASGVVACGDGEKLRQVLANLLENARDALADTAGARKIVLAVASANGAATVRVSDSGPGVPPGDVPHLFEPFFSRKTTGTGLGLAIAKRTVDAHGGRIAATSPPGAGLTVCIELPLAADASQRAGS